MKRLLFASLLVLVAACDGAPNPSSLAGTDQVIINPEAVDHEYKINTPRWNGKVYEFTPKSHRGKSCVMFMLINGRGLALQCFDKPRVGIIHDNM